MCGIVAVARRPSDRPVPDVCEVMDLLSAAGDAFPTEAGPGALRDGLGAAADLLRSADELLQGTPGARCLLASASGIDEIEGSCAGLERRLGTVEEELDRGAVEATADLEAVNAAVVRVKDALWAIRRDRIGTARGIAALCGPDATPSAVEAYGQLQIALSAIDRLEVRGRDSAGVHVMVRGHDLDATSAALREALVDRGDPLFRSRSVRAPGDLLCFVYKAAAEIGELGDNTAAIRSAIAEDDLLRRAVSAPGSRVTVLGHTRWASVGMISEANAHPLSSEEEDGAHGPYVVAALNGDVDNYADLKAEAGLRVPPEITTDAKVIPALTSRGLSRGEPLEEAFRRTVASFEGSVAIASASAEEPAKLQLALRGSGQALYVGFAEDAFIVASEPYGLVEQCRRYLRMDGETPTDPANPQATRGQIVVLDAERAGELDGIRRSSYGGAELPVSEDELTVPAITTRDIDRGEHPHFLIKEITESPRSFRKTLRGKLLARDARLQVVLGEDVIPASVSERLSSGGIRRVLVIGQGTAAVAGRSCAENLRRMLEGTSVTAEALAATELSGFRMADDMSDSLVVAISQSGTTTDTNRTVDLARARGAAVIAIVNRRNSDLTDRADGVLYTSDGRDVEMAVPSTKAFYSQVAAGFLLGIGIAERAGAPVTARRQDLLEALRDLPEAMEKTLATREAVAQAAQRHALSRRYWAVVGNGLDRIAAEEVRIKLSELCYKSIACDATEDKKHIDLSAEPMILVCAAGLRGSNADDVAKEVAIYRAHKAAPIVIAPEGEQRFRAALEVLTVPSVHPDVAFVLSAMAGHLFGYEAALAIDGQARLLREARAAVESAAAIPENGRRLMDHLRDGVSVVAARFFESLRVGEFDGNLGASSAVRLTSVLRYALGISPLDGYQIEHGRVGTPAVIAEDLAAALSEAIDELTRPIDAIKHQAKTVTVGISRADEDMMTVRLVQAVVSAGAGRDRLSYRTLRALAALDPAVEDVLGHTHYRIEGDVVGDEAQIHVTDKGGLARDIPSRTERDPRLRGTKHRVASERAVLVARGRSDDRTVVLVPEVKGTEVTGLTLLHVRFHDRLPAAVMRDVLGAYRDRYAALRDLVTETEPTFREDVLGEIGVTDLLVDSIQVLADRWRSNDP